MLWLKTHIFSQSVDFSIACMPSCCSQLCNTIPWAVSAATTVQTARFKRETGNGATYTSLAAKRCDASSLFAADSERCGCGSACVVSAFHRLPAVADGAFVCLFLPGRVPAPPWKGKVWGCTTPERVSLKLCTSRCHQKEFCAHHEWTGQRKMFV